MSLRLSATLATNRHVACRDVLTLGSGEASETELRLVLVAVIAGLHIVDSCRR